ncbi:MAG: hypothetical protein ACRDYY_01640 [Acidimicrobiales bacterium]
MTTFTTGDLRTALHEEADKAVWAGEDVWPTIRRRIVRQRRYRAGTTVLIAAGVVGLVLGLLLPNSPQTPSQRFLIRPVSYQQACSSEPNVCQPGIGGSIPATLFPPLQLPRVAPGASCPVTPGSNSTDQYVSGQQYGGAGPVWMVLGDQGDPSRGTSVLGNPETPGWLAAENVWLVAPGYQGPFTVRGAGLDGRGTVGFGGTPTTSAFVEPPAPDPNSSDGWRFPPGTIWVTNPGCYGFQIDGTSFSQTVVIDMQPPSAG